MRSILKVITIATIGITSTTSAVKADLADIFIGIAGAIILDGVIKELTKEDRNPQGNIDYDNKVLP